MTNGSGSADATLELALDLHEKGDVAAAAALYRALLQTHPDEAQLWGLLGSACRLDSNAAEAVEALQKAVSLAPARIDLKAELGIALAEAERHLEARQMLEDLLPALAVQQQDAAVVYAALADACLGLEDFQNAVRHYEMTLRKDPDNRTASINLATALQKLGQPGEAIALYESVIKEQPENVSALTNLGVALQETGLIEQSLVPLEKAVALAPDDAVAQTDLAVSLQKLDRIDEAETALNSALNSDINYARAWSNLGNLLQEKMHLPEARMAHDCAVAIEPDDPELHWNRAMALLLDGALAEGLAEYEWRRRRPDFRREGLIGAEWDGSSPSGQRILVYTEQGVGDAIQFCRFATLLAETGAAVILACPAVLASLFATLQGQVDIVTNLSDAQPYNQHAPLMSLPYLMDMKADDIPAAVPYLSVPRGTTPPLPARNGSNRLRVGLVWAGNPDHANDKNRSVALSAFRPLFDMQDIEWLSLQLGPQSSQAADASVFLDDLSSRLETFADTAAAMAELDLIISVDTAAAHLAGAMGLPVWTLLPFAPDWRWGAEGDRSPWYPTMRLFRQTTRGDWLPVIAAVRGALRRRLQHMKVGE